MALADARPAHIEVADLLREAIYAGELAPGEQLPSRPELAVQCEVDVPTGQRALRILLDGEVIVWRKGQGGYVRGTPQHQLRRGPPTPR
jgi:GntR family transcriptional regulator